MLTGLAMAAMIAVGSCTNNDPPEVVITRPAESTGPDVSTDTPGTLDTDSELRVVMTPIGDGQQGLVDLEPAPAGGFYGVYRNGVIRLISADGRESREVLRLDDVVDDDLEQGLLALAVSPEGTHAYINYTADAREGVERGDGLLVEYRLAGSGSFETDTARTVLVVSKPSDKHNSHELVFGPDGYLYVGVGDGSFANDPSRRGLDKSTLLGKILRVDPFVDAGSFVPLDNPFVGEVGARPEIWAYGLRNPWRFTFDEANGDLWIADVGQSGNEEVDVARAVDGRDAGKGISFGWSAFEGNKRFHKDQPAAGHRRPVYTYHHDNGRCAIVGADVYRGERLEQLRGAFVFGDFCSGEIWAIGNRRHQNALPLGTVPAATAVREIDGDLYVLSLSDGLFRVDPA